MKITATLVICAAIAAFASPALAGSKPYGGSTIIKNRNTNVAVSNSSSSAYAKGGNASVNWNEKIQPGGASAPSFGGGNCAVGFGLTLPYIGGGFSSQTLQDDCQILNAAAVAGGLGYRSYGLQLIEGTEVVQRLRARVSARKTGGGRSVASSNGCRIPSKQNPSVCLD